MVAIQSIISALAMALMVNATPTEIVARGESVGVITTFNAAACADPARHQYQVDRNNPSTGHIAAGTCVSETAYGSIAVDFVGTNCQFEKHLSGTCSDAPFDVVTAFNGNRKCLGGEAAPANFWRVACTS